ncbi:MAG: cell division protein FtsZ [Betaproteobacteria bacterium]|nr:cell division protein FtsZ [Betaproteobacteria bacterium]
MAINELQLGLIGLGAAAVLAVFGYNRWQARQHRRTAEEMLRQEHEDVLLQEGNPAAVEYPTLGEVADDAGSLPPPQTPELEIPPPQILPPAASAPAPSSSGGFIARATQVFRSKGAVQEEAPASRLEPVLFPVPPARLLSSAIDYLAAFELSERVSGSRILDSQREALEGIGKRISWVGVSERTRDWETVEAGSDYRRLYVGLQLADRRGPLGEADLVAFQGAMQALAEDLKAVLNQPPRSEALTAAIALDRFCADLDIQIGINILSRKQPFSGTQIRRLAESAGMRFEERGDGGFFVRYGSEGAPLYCCGNREKPAFAEEAIEIVTTSAIFFLLDVPRVADGEQAFTRMLAEAQRFAEALDGALADDNDRPLSETQLGPIRIQIVQKQAAMAERDLPAGGPLALRLFS